MSGILGQNSNGSTPIRRYLFRTEEPPGVSRVNRRALRGHSMHRLGSTHMYNREQASLRETGQSPAEACHRARAFLVGPWEIQTGSDTGRTRMEAPQGSVPEKSSLLRAGTLCPSRNHHPHK